MSRFNFNFTGRDYAALAMSLLLACLFWLVRNLSMTYSSVVQLSVLVESNIPGYSARSVKSAEIAARCEMDGFGIMSCKTNSSLNPERVLVSAEDLHPSAVDGYFYMTAEGINKYFHDIFGAQAKLEYFVSDTVMFEFTKMNCKKVPVEVSKDISLAPQYISINGLSITPDSVLVYGSTSELKAVHRVTTNLVYLNQLQSDAYGEVALKSPNGLRMDCNKVAYSIDVVRYAEMEMEVPVRLTDAPDDVKFDIVPDKAMVKMKLVFPSDVSFNDVYVRISHHDFAAAKTSKCIGTVMNLPETVIESTTVPEVFDCFVVR